MTTLSTELIIYESKYLRRKIEQIQEELKKDNKEKIALLSKQRVFRESLDLIKIQLQACVHDGSRQAQLELRKIKNREHVLDR